MLVSLSLESSSALGMAKPTMTVGQSAVPVEEIEVRFDSQIGIAADARDPDQKFRGREVDPKAYS